jgi:myosin heavy subunit
VEVAKKCKNCVGEKVCGGVIEEYLLTPSRLIDQTENSRAQHRY